MATQEENAARGVDAAQEAVRAYVRGDEATTLAVLNGCTPKELASAAGYLISMVSEMAMVLAKGDQAEAARLIDVSTRDTGDAETAQARVILHEEWKRLFG